MIKAVLIDDERPSLRELEYLLKEDGNFAVVGAFINPLEAIDQISTLNPQVVFLASICRRQKALTLLQKSWINVPL